MKEEHSHVNKCKETWPGWGWGKKEIGPNSIHTSTSFTPILTEGPWRWEVSKLDKKDFTGISNYTHTSIKPIFNQSKYSSGILIISMLIYF